MSKTDKPRVNINASYKKLELENEFYKKITRESLDVEQLAKEKVITYYNSPFKTVQRCEYDILHHFTEGYDQKVKYDTTRSQHILWENIFKEESLRKVPLITSHNYAFRKTDLEGRPVAYHKRVTHMREMMRRHEVNLKHQKKVPPVYGYPGIS